MNITQCLVKSLAFSFLLMMGFVSCNDSQSSSSEAKPKAATEKVKEEAVNKESKNYCFQNEYPHTDTKDKDIVELSIKVNNGFAQGTYNWLPALKDQRRGKFRGKMENNVVKGEYSFSQEGTAQTTRIEITINERGAVVKGLDHSLGLNETIPKVECGD